MDFDPGVVEALAGGARSVNSRRDFRRGWSHFRDVRKEPVVLDTYEVTRTFMMIWYIKCLSRARMKTATFLKKGTPEVCM